MKNLILISLFGLIGHAAFAAETIQCTLHNVNDNANMGKPIPLSLTVGAPETKLTWKSDVSATGEFLVSLRLMKFSPDLGGKYRLEIMSGAVGNPELLAISYINSDKPEFNGRTWLYDKSSGSLIFTMVDYECK